MLGVRAKNGRKVNVKPKPTRSEGAEVGEAGVIDVIQCIVQNGAKRELNLDVRVNSCERVIVIPKVVPRELVEFDDPFNCEHSCGYCSVYFILHKMGLAYCSCQLIRNMHLTANKEMGDCLSSLDYFSALGVLEEKEIFSKEITETFTIERALKDAHKSIKKQLRPALLALEYEDKKLVNHCVVIMPDGETVIDVQSKRYWTPQPNKRISRIHVVNVNENAINDWIDYSGIATCAGSLIFNP